MPGGENGTKSCPKAGYMLQYIDRVSQNSAFTPIYWKEGQAMPPIPRSLTELIGNTPLLEPARYMQREGCVARLLLKLEGFNPLRSDRKSVV